MELKTEFMIVFFHISLWMFASERNGNPSVVKDLTHFLRPDSSPSTIPIKDGAIA